MTRWILERSEAAGSALAGGKARALAHAERAGLPVPAWFVLSAAALIDSLTPYQRTVLENPADAAVLQDQVGGVVTVAAQDLLDLFALLIAHACPPAAKLTARLSTRGRLNSRPRFNK